jgi:amino acid adenylation domain-containing protein/natural product biosynthesis luciferase-like monooxygenase protein
MNTLIDYLAAQVTKTPDATAVRAEGEAWSYRALWERAGAVAARLQESGAGPGSRVGVMVERSFDLIAGLVGVLRAGAAYVPLDPEDPPDRLSFIAEDARVAALLTHRTYAPVTNAPVIRLETIGKDSPTWTPPQVVEGDLAYVIYTSGSTGRPKGAMNTHRAIVNRLVWMQQAYELTADDRVLQKTPTSFDVSVWELFWPLMVGSQLVFARPGGHRDSAYLVDIIARERITTLHFVPSMMVPFLDEPDLQRCASLRHVVCSGEALSAELRNRAHARLPAQLHNLYGPTEAAVDVTAWTCPRGGDPDEIVPIGMPIENVHIHLFDADLSLVPDGEIGELFIGGVAVGEGYLHRPALTAERFLPDPYARTPGARMYRTGDLGRRRPDGSIEFLGRIDHQVKIRGVRIELSEIESHLLRHPGVREAVVAAHTGPDGQKKLCAYVVASEGQSLSIRPLRRHLEASLPVSVIPSAFVPMPALPLLSSGKVDRKRLPAPDDAALGSEEEFVAPRDEQERRLVVLFERVLQRRVGVLDSFFELGGDSILALQVAAGARVVGLHCTPDQIFRLRTVAALSAEVRPWDEKDESQSGTDDDSPRNGAIAPNGAIEQANIAEEARALAQKYGGIDAYPMSPIQEGVLFHAVSDPALGMYFEHLVVTCDAHVDRASIATGFERVVDRHDVFRSSFHWQDLSQPLQVVHARATLPVEYEDWRDAGENVRDRLSAFLEADRRRGFDFTVPPLCRLTFAERPDGKCYVIFSYHHVLLDGWSMIIVLREALGTAALEVPPPFRDYIKWRARQPVAPMEQFWREELRGVVGPTPLPLERPVGRGPRGPAVRNLPLSEALSSELAGFARAHGITQNTLLQAAWGLVLSRYSGSEDVVFGMTTAGRPPGLRGVADMVGVLINTLPFRVRIDGQARVCDWLESIQRHALSLAPLAHSALVKVHELSSVPRRQRLFESVLVYQNMPIGRWIKENLPGYTLESGDLPEQTNFPLMLEGIPSARGLTLKASFDQEQFVSDAIDRLLRHLAQALTRFVRTPVARLSEISLATEQDLSAIRAFNIAKPVRSPACFPDLFEAQVALTPDAPALSHEGTTLTYREVNALADSLAVRLRALGVMAGARVGVSLERSQLTVIALLAVLKAEAAYVPLDPTYPRDRLTFITQDARLHAILTDQGREGQFSDLKAHVVVLGKEDCRVPAKAPVPIRRDAQGPRDVAYVIHTSGSTGTPKGVCVTHANVSAFFDGMDGSIRVGDGPRVWLAVTSISFDIAVLELLWTLVRGFHVVVVTKPSDLVSRPATARAFDLGLYFFPDDDPRARGADKYALLKDAAQFADARGFSSIWIPERHFASFGGSFPSPAIAAATVAAVTKRIAIRAGSVVLPLHDPVRIAEEWAMLDHLSGGRIGVSFASGWHPGDFVFAPERFAQRSDAMLEGIRDIRALWSGQRIRRRDGAGRDIDVELRPAPLQKELPLWVTAAGNPATFEMAGRLGASVLTHLLGQGLDDLRRSIARYREAYRASGHPGEGKVTLLIHTFLGADHDATIEKARPALRRYLESAAALTRTSRSGQQATEQEQALLLDEATERYLSKGGLFGSIERARPLALQLHEVGVDELGCLIDFGIDRDDVMAGLEPLDKLRHEIRAALDTARDESLPALVARYGVTHMQMTPSLLRALVDDRDCARTLSSLRQVVVGGEALPSALADDVVALGVPLINAYGPTETTVWSLTCDIDEIGRTPPIGRPIAGTRAYVIDSCGHLAPVGIAGELCIGGAGVTDGYHERPATTATRFIPDCFEGAVPGERLYRTGDLARLTGSGVMDFLGRIDHQVKIRGHRIELGEIEAALERHASVRSAIVMPHKHPGGEVLLVAHVVAADVATVELEQTLLKHLASSLPAAMIPARVRFVDTLPLTPNRKVDRRAIQLPDDFFGGPTNTEAALESPLEHALARVWIEVLRVPKVGRHDNFHALGGDSLSALRVISLAQANSLRVTIADLLHQPTLAALAAVVEPG